MKKTLLLAAAALIGFTASAQTLHGYTKGETITDASQLTSGKYILGIYSKGTYKLGSYSDSRINFNSTNPSTITSVEANSTYVFDIAVADDGTFTIRYDAETPMYSTVALKNNGQKWVGEGQQIQAVSTTYPIEAKFALDTENQIVEGGEGVAAQPAGHNTKLWRVKLANYTAEGNHGTTSVATAQPYLMDGGKGFFGFWSGVNTPTGDNHHAAVTFYKAEPVYVDPLAGIKTLNGHKVVLRGCGSSDPNGHNPFMTALNATTLKHYDEISPNAVWTINIDESNHVSLRNCVFGTYVVNVSELGETAGQNLKIRVSATDTPTESYNIYDSTKSSSENFNHFPNNAINWYGPGTGSSWTITEVNEEQLTTLYNAALAKCDNPFPDYTFGNYPGAYTYPEGTTEADYKAALRANAEAIRANGEFDFVKCYEVMHPTDVPALFDLNTLAAPALVRIKSAACNTGAAGAYLSNSNTVVNSTTRATFTATADDNNTFVLHNGNLTSLTSGYYLCAPAGSNKALAHIQNCSGTAADNSGATILFTDGTAKSAGSYLINYGVSEENPSKTYYMYGDGTKTDRGSVTASQGVTHLFGMGNWYGYFFNVEYVNEISLNVNGDLLYRAPVAVSLNGSDNITAYVITVKGKTITTTAANAADNVVYAAGTGFIFHGTGSVTLTAHNGETGVETYAEAIGGHHSLHSYAPAEGKLALVISTPAANDIDLQSDGTVKMVAISGNEAMAAHAAAIEVTDPNLKADNTVDVLLGGSTDTTGISEINAEKAGNAAIFDLQGRRLSSPVRGINIIGGRKVLVK